jgi:hypothetical protein
LKYSANIFYLHLLSLIQLYPQVQIPSNFWQKQSPDSQCVYQVLPRNNSEKETNHLFKIFKIFNCGGMAEFARSSVIHPRYPCSHLGSDRKYFLILLVSHLNPNLLVVSSWTLFVNIHLLWPIMLDPFKHVAKKTLTTICRWRETI